MTLSKFGKLTRRFERYINNDGNIDPNTLLNDLIDYQKKELARVCKDSSVQSEQDHSRLTNQLESMITTLRPNQENMNLSKRRRV